MFLSKYSIDRISQCLYSLHSCKPIPPYTSEQSEILLYEKLRGSIRTKPKQFFQPIPMKKKKPTIISPIILPLTNSVTPKHLSEHKEKPILIPPPAEKKYKFVVTPTSRCPVPSTYSTDDADEYQGVSLLNEDTSPGSAWEKMIEEDNVTVYARENLTNDRDNPSTTVFLIEGVLPYPSKKVFKANTDFEWQKNWEEMAKRGNIIQEHPLTEDGVLIKDKYLYMKFPPFIDDRDFVIRDKAWENYAGMKDHYLTIGKSFEHPDYPPKDGIVRGLYLIKAGYYKPLDENHTKYFGLVNIQLRFNVPSGMVKSRGANAQKKWFITFSEKIQDYNG